MNPAQGGYGIKLTHYPEVSYPSKQPGTEVKIAVDLSLVQIAVTPAGWYDWNAGAVQRDSKPMAA